MIILGTIHPMEAGILVFYKRIVFLNRLKSSSGLKIAVLDYLEQK
jgi:hypothetical protein